MLAGRQGPNVGRNRPRAVSTHSQEDDQCCGSSRLGRRTGSTARWRCARQQLAPNARRIDESGQFPRENFDAIRKSGLFTIGVPEEMGGAGVDHVGVALVCEELARGCASTAM